MVCSITRRPAKPSRAPISPTMTSDKVANDAATPPNVGSVTTEIVSRPAESRRSHAALVLAICMSAMAPSCILAPPDAVTTIIGNRRSRAASAASINAEPACTPRLPPKKRKSITATTAGLPSMHSWALVTAPSRPVFARASASLRGYGMVSTNPRTSGLSRCGRSSCFKLPGSASCSSRVSPSTMVWCPHSGQTSLDLIHRFRYTIARHVSHSTHSGHVATLSLIDDSPPDRHSRVLRTHLQRPQDTPDLRRADPLDPDPLEDVRIDDGA